MLLAWNTHLQQEFSVLMVGLPNAVYLVASCRIRGMPLFQQQATLSPDGLRHKAQLSKDNTLHVTEGT